MYAAFLVVFAANAVVALNRLTSRPQSRPAPDLGFKEVSRDLFFSALMTANVGLCLVVLDLWVRGPR